MLYTFLYNILYVEEVLKFVTPEKLPLGATRHRCLPPKFGPDNSNIIRNRKPTWDYIMYNTIRQRKKQHRENITSLPLLLCFVIILDAS